ncbi:glycosyltransferase [Treponema sp. OMZ 792]|uniref:glycosyltransferase n=1 Tax=unclassified Treponema TaxID=2638727 RepID=UPI0020A5FF49|nr:MULTISPECIES: glycosyltransferase [unclassified Treponema]UTC76282.1 glycosyltransferase [Treponema sp. OMZ 792]UTC77840.1 glycosyltransferase family 4 protein [Treponema sp. OMZ 799]UTC80282.1 glycosyltransferase family 4 protein [Treponema sp. OMZ 798]
MKILHIITNTELGGAQTVCISLANMASNEGNTVAVASMEGGYLWDNLDSSVIRFKIKNMVKPISLLPDLKCYFELKNEINKFSPDIIHLHSSKAGVLGRLAGRKYKKSIIYTVHGFDSIRLKHRFFLPLERFLQKYCGAIVAVSHYDKQNLLKEKITHKVKTIRNGIVKPEEEAAIPFDIGKYKKVVITIARIAYPKKFQSFLSVASDPAMKDYLFVWAGGSAEKSMEEIKKEFSIPSNVLLLGDCPNASGLLPYCDLFVLFSNYEGLPMTIIEAMAQKKAIVASNVGGIPELVDNTNGLLIETDEDAVKAISNILQDNEKKSKMERASFEKFSNFFTLDIMWKNYRNLYKEIAKG